MRLFWIFIFFISSSFTAQAAISVDELRKLAYERDFRAVDDALALAHKESVNGTISYDDLRLIITALLSTHPDIIDFVNDWPSVMPDSPYALSARSHSYLLRAFDLRGSALGQDTSPEAHNSFNLALELGMSDAWRAYRLEPDFVPATDAVLLTNAFSHVLPEIQFRSIVDNIIRLTPNLGSVRRIAASGDPNWGGDNYEFAWYVCHETEGTLRDAPNISADGCFVNIMMREGKLREVLDWASEVLDEDPHEKLNHARIYRSIVEKRIDETDQIRRWIDDITFDEWNIRSRINIAALYFATFPQKNNNDIDAFRNRMLERVDEQLIEDPFNTKLLEIAIGGYPISLLPKNHIDDRYKRLVRRLAAAQPFNAENWRSVVRTTRTGVRREFFFARDTAFINAIYYSGHSLRDVENFFDDRVFKYMTFIEPEVSEEFPAEMTWAVMPSEDVMLQVVSCEIVRLARLLELAGNEDTAHQEYVQKKFQLPSFAKAIAHIRESGNCEDVWSAPIETLFFEPIEVSFADVLAAE